jgi:hypothetical protein
MLAKSALCEQLSTEGADNAGEIAPCPGRARWRKASVTTGRRPNADYRKREHLTETEIEKLIEAAKTNRYGHRDSTMILKST